MCSQGSEEPRKRGTMELGGLSAGGESRRQGEGGPISHRGPDASYGFVLSGRFLGEEGTWFMH